MSGATSELEPIVYADSEDDIDWEEVEVEAQPELERHLEITLHERPKLKDKVKKKGISHADRVLRINCHKIHTVSLLANAWVRNKWLNDELLHARLMSFVPMSIQTSFVMIHKSRVPDQAKRGRMFEKSLDTLVKWWYESFFEVLPEGHIRNRTFDFVQRRMPLDSQTQTGEECVLDTEVLQDILDDDVERIKSSKSLMKHALMQSGSRDTGAQLFTALCRGLGIPARLIVSLQSVPWQAGVGKPRPKYDKKKKNSQVRDPEDGEPKDETPIASTSASSLNDLAFKGEGQRLDGAPVGKSDKAKGKEKAKPTVKLRKTKSKGNVLGAAPPKKEDPTSTPPVFWTEVFSRPDGRWIPIDPLRAVVNKRNVFDPTGMSQQNRLVYVLAIEEDGYARDVTRKYARQYGAKVAKVQGGAVTGGGGKGREAWWERVVSIVTRPYRLNRDDVEDTELESAQIREGMPTTISRFKDHPLYVLTRHLKQTEAIHPPPPDTPELGKFRGEPVYPRSSIVSLKTAENWLRTEGRSVREGVQPLKMIKSRPGTIGRMRELEILKDSLREAGEDADDQAQVMHGLYARGQTELYVPKPVVDGKIPKNDFGNIDLYVPTMLPRGAVHVPFKGVQKIAKKLGLDYADAVIGFEFKKRRAFPVLEGVVVAVENEQVLLDAYWETEQDAQEKARVKREEKAIKRWTRLIHGLRIRQRLQEQYAGRGEDKATEKEDEEKQPEHGGAGGGFLVGADDVVQAFHLPKAPRLDIDLESDLVASTVQNLLSKEDGEKKKFDLETMDVDSDLDEVVVMGSATSHIPKTMRELAEDAARLRVVDNEEEEEVDPPKKDGNGNRRGKGKDSGTSRKGGSKSKRRKRGRDLDESEGEGEGEASPAKRGKTVASSTRTLRPRASKNRAKIEEETAHEDAIRLAIGE
ncbi:Rad4-domain-containing protein [Guyanagaster necrorhizus]|uniref:Rad4-domain-containing protein n=1 Tax=Guyanagaster necrorhizus TaxID=856835 RepID=A0A9P7VS72_9AGAR|nr:Rad4-domain-containing protein [Guyanagaster necrorhizus MCA 3950]KAG7445688.1 Rad4-domain-containing protein [Guyanagaster necrorhizus MCA 3950]